MFSRIQMEDISFIDFAKRGSIRNKSIVARIMRNGILICKLKNVPLAVLNIYITPNLDHNWEEGNKYNKFIISQLIELSHVINEITRKKVDCIATGDFNTDKNSYIFKNFLHMTHMDDVFSNYSSPTYHKEFLKNGSTPKRIDFVLLSNRHHHIKIHRQKQVFIEKQYLGEGIDGYLSDHIGLFTDLTLSF